MSGDYCATKTLENVTVQENGLIRNSRGHIIARLTDEIKFDSIHLDDSILAENMFEPYICTEAFGDIAVDQYIYYCKDIDKWYTPENQLNHAMGRALRVKIPTCINAMDFVEAVEEIDDLEQLE